MLDIVTKLSYNFNLVDIFKESEVVILLSCLGISSLFTQLAMTVFPSAELFSRLQHILTKLLKLRHNLIFAGYEVKIRLIVLSLNSKQRRSLLTARE